MIDGTHIRSWHHPSFTTNVYTEEEAMPALEYITSGGYAYRQQPDGRMRRIPRTDGRPVVGATVRVIIKPYVQKRYVTGRVARVLTRKAVHTRGHKVQLEDGTIGRVVA